MSKACEPEINLEHIHDRWQAVVDDAEKIDPGQHFNWEGVLLGFLLGEGVPIGQAMRISSGAPANDWEI